MFNIGDVIVTRHRPGHLMKVVNIVERGPVNGWEKRPAVKPPVLIVHDGMENRIRTVYAGSAKLFGGRKVVA